MKSASHFKYHYIKLLKNKIFQRYSLISELSPSVWLAVLNPKVTVLRSTVFD